MKKLSMEELQRLSIDEFKKLDKIPLAIVLDNVRSLSNVGSAFRNADAFKVEQISLCGITAQPPHREIQKTALGATESVEWNYYENTLDCIKEYREAGYEVISIEQTVGSVSLLDFSPSTKKKYCIVLGNEVAGVQQEVINESDFCLEVPQFGTKHSINVSVCSGILMWDFLQKWQR